jgi:hypothetical protein
VYLPQLVAHVAPDGANLGERTRRPQELGEDLKGAARVPAVGDEGHPRERTRTGGADRVLLVEDDRPVSGANLNTNRLRLGAEPRLHVEDDDDLRRRMAATAARRGEHRAG